MDDTLQNNRDFLLARELGMLLHEHHGVDVIVMDMRPLDFWTDFFVIATATSNTHLVGLERHIKDFVREKGLEILRRSRRAESNAGQSSAGNYTASDSVPGEWNLLDLGSIVIHLMDAKIRSFFELERLWSAAPVIFASEEKSGAGSYSSKSS